MGSRSLPHSLNYNDSSYQISSSTIESADSPCDIQDTDQSQLTSRNLKLRKRLSPIMSRESSSSTSNADDDHLTFDNHIEALLASLPPRTGNGPTAVDGQAWEALIDRWEAEIADVGSDGGVNHNKVQDADENEDLLPDTPLPDLLDFYVPSQSLPDSGTSTSPLSNEISATRSLKRNVGDSREGQGTSKLHEIDIMAGNGGKGVGEGSEGNTITPAVKDLVGKIRRQLPETSMLSSLREMLDSSRSPDDLQDSLVNLFGYEGDAFEIMAELLKPGVRKEVGKALSVSPKTNTNTNRKKGDQQLLLGDASTATGGRSGGPANGLPGVGYSQEEINARIEAQLDEAAARPLFSGTGQAPETIHYPHVYTSATVNATSSYGGRLALPMGTIRKEDDLAEEVVIPPARPLPPKTSERLISVHELGPLAAGCFPGYQTLNRIQSIVQPVAMTTNENMLVCAPTGAGKTDVAIMAILRVLIQHVRSNATPPYGTNSIRKDEFKVIYVAPMKALAAEITRKFSKRLAWLGIKVRELTGDMQLSRQEINDTQIIVTTPEKWDVVTRKPTGEGELASKVKLLIIDEVHLLNEERGAVIETIVARTLRQVESSQSLIRIVGLSATLPNYIDVSDFLRVNRFQGLFYFDSSFRPVPLEQHFIGVRGKARSETSKRNMDQAVFDKVAENLAAGHQVMVFVHARKETVKTAEKLKEMALTEGAADDFDPRNHPQFDFFRKEIGTSRNKEMKQLFDYGFGIHHAGMLRSDRNMIERMFEANCIKVLVCTATLAWGVNLPAHAVVIKGTNVYDAGKGSFVDLSILDVLQIFGRAGRPGYETSGVGYICTTQDKLDHYLDAVLSQHPIESKFVPGMLDSLNAEISLGTIANVAEAIEWLGYTYLFVRMKRNPFVYGMAHDVTAEDPQLGGKRDALVQSAGKRLADIKMVQFDEQANKFAVTDLGRIAAKYYLKHETVEVFNTEFKSKMSEADTLALLSMSTEFLQIQVRENEVEELKNLMDNVIPCQVRGGTDTTPGKVNILLQGYICQAYIEDFALVSDTAYVAQNAGRIIRALLEIALSRRWASASAVLASMSKSIEKRLWSYENPMRQCHLQKLVMHNLEQYADDYTPGELAAYTAAEMGELIHMNEKHGAAVVTAAKQFPNLSVAYRLRPLADDLLRVDVDITRNFEWNENLHGTAEPFYVWVEDENGVDIYQSQHVLIRRSTRKLPLEFMVPIRNEIPKSITIKLISDRWVGCDETIRVSLETIVLPETGQLRTPLLSLPFLSVNSIIHDDRLQASYLERFSTLNAIQSQIFWSLYHSDINILLSAPNSSGKSTIADMATWRSLKRDTNAKVLYVTAGAQSARETIGRLSQMSLSSGRRPVKHLQSRKDLVEFDTSHSGIGIITASALANYLVAVPQTGLSLSLVVYDDLHLLDAAYELAITVLGRNIKRSTCRIVALSSSLQDPTDLASWLEIQEMGIFCFQPSDRPYPLLTQVQTFGIPHSIALLKSMVKPTYAAIKQDVGGNTIVFVPSRGQCSTVANDLVTQSGTEMDLNGFLNASRVEVEPFTKRLRDQSLAEPILHGIGAFHEGMTVRDIALNLELFAAGILRVLVVPRDACWTLPVQASTVVVMGAQYLEIKTNEDESKVINGQHIKVIERSTKSYSLHEMVRMQSFAARPPPPSSLSKSGGSSGKFLLFCQPEQREIYLRFLNNGLPLESDLSAALKHEESAKRVSKMLIDLFGLNGPVQKQKQDMMDFLARTYLWRRTQANPTYYDVVEGWQVKALSRLVDTFMEGSKKAVAVAIAPKPRDRDVTNGTAEA